jgi:acyl-CoA thioesterase
MTIEATHPFDGDISLVQLDRFRFRGVVSPAWSINNTPHGGYLMALAANAMLQVSGKKSTPIVTANFAARCGPGEIEIWLEKISRSNQFERFQARLIQEGGEKLRVLGTFADISEAGETRYETAAPQIAAVENCREMPARTGYGLFDQVSVQLDPGSAGWLTGRLANRSEHRGWFSFRNARPFDIPAILLAADAFPPPVFASQGMVAWVPTLELSVHIRGIPAGSRLKCVFRTRFITNGLLEEDGELWDESGELVAISRQIAQFRRGR